ncbi:MAG: LacI family transcriptional regulator [Hyphomicrobiales bacterium]|nr:LacI family transcriptional regulator [Hyphomicrobiales bacterium]
MDIVVLAKRLGLSISTVSRALNNAKDVSAATRARVLRAADDLGYRPNRSSRRLRSTKPETVGFLLTPPQRQFADPVYMEALTGLSDALATRGLDLSVTLPRSMENEFLAMRRMVESKAIDAIVISRTRRDDDRIRYLLDARFPFVSWGRTEVEEPYPFFDGDFEYCGRVATERLLSHGHRRIALLTPSRTFMYAELQWRGYRAALKAFGVAYDRALARETLLDAEQASDVVYEWLVLPKPPTAIVCSSDLFAICAFDAIRRRGLEPGRDVAVIGWGADPLIGLAQPRLTTFRVDLHAAGHLLAETLFAYIDSKQSTAMQNVWLPELIVRDSDPPLG